MLNNISVGSIVKINRLMKKCCRILAYAYVLHWCVEQCCQMV